MSHRTPLHLLCATGLLFAMAPAALADPQMITSTSPTMQAGGAVDHWDLEGDVSDYLESGYSLWAGYKPAALPQWRFALGTFAANLPGFLVPTGWTVRETGYLVAGAHWYPSGDRRGWYLGGLVGYVQSGFGNTAAAGQSAAIGHLSLVPAVGYQWFPLGDHFYVEPWLGLSFNLPLGSEPTLAGQTVPDTFFNPLPALHLGWEF